MHDCTSPPMYSGHPAASSGSGYVAPNSGPSDRFDPVALVVPAVCAFLQKTPLVSHYFASGPAKSLLLQLLN